MVLKAVPISASDQGDDLWIAPKTGRSMSQCLGSSKQTNRILDYQRSTTAFDWVDLKRKATWVESGSLR